MNKAQWRTARRNAAVTMFWEKAAYRWYDWALIIAPAAFILLVCVAR